MRRLIITAATFLLVLLWVYALASKVTDFGHFQVQMQRQVFLPGIAKALVYIVPATESIIILLLCARSYRIYGFLFSAFLLTAFSIYIALVISGAFHKVPCSCGGVLESIGWVAHLILNLAFLALSIAGFLAENIHLKERRLNFKQFA